MISSTTILEYRNEIVEISGYLSNVNVKVAFHNLVFYGHGLPALQEVLGNPHTTFNFMGFLGQHIYQSTCINALPEAASLIEVGDSDTGFTIKLYIEEAIQAMRRVQKRIRIRVGKPNIIDKERMLRYFDYHEASFEPQEGTIVKDRGGFSTILHARIDEDQSDSIYENLLIQDREALIRFSPILRRVYGVVSSQS